MEQLLELMALDHDHQFLQQFVVFKEVLESESVHSVKVYANVDIRFNEVDGPHTHIDVFLQEVIIFPYDHHILGHLLVQFIGNLLV